MFKRFIPIIALIFLVSLGNVASATQENRTWLDDHLDGAVLDPSAPPIWDFEVVNTFPHDTGAYTQGLIYVDGRLFEGTGQYGGESDIREVDLESGAVLREHPLSEEYFGEGIVLVGDRLFQITWKEQTAFVYDRDTFELIGQHTYSGQGWGLTWNGSHIVMSNGSNVITFRDPKSFLPVQEIKVFDGEQAIASLNELEWIDGEIWANVYLTDWVVRIDPESGEVLGWIDFRGLLPEELEEGTGVLNGIALDEETGRLFVTGKYWPLLFEIELVERSAP